MRAVGLLEVGLVAVAEVALVSPVRGGGGVRGLVGLVDIVAVGVVLEGLVLEPAAAAAPEPAAAAEPAAESSPEPVRLLELMLWLVDRLVPASVVWRATVPETVPATGEAGDEGVDALEPSKVALLPVR